MFVVFAIFGLLFYLHYLQYTLKTNEIYQYSKLAKDKYVSIVINDYNQTKLLIENKLKKEMTQYAVIYKSYLSGFLFGLSIFDMNPNNSTPIEIYSIKEQKL